MTTPRGTRARWRRSRRGPAPRAGRWTAWARKWSRRAGRRAPAAEGSPGDDGGACGAPRTDTAHSVLRAVARAGRAVTARVRVVAGGWARQAAGGGGCDPQSAPGSRPRARPVRTAGLPLPRRPGPASLTLCHVTQTHCFHFLPSCQGALSPSSPGPLTLVPSPESPPRDPPPPPCCPVLSPCPHPDLRGKQASSNTIFVVLAPPCFGILIFYSYFLVPSSTCKCAQLSPVLKILPCFTIS